MHLSVFGGESYNGYKVDVLKSGINKYTRRCMLEKLIYCVVELDKFKIMGDKSKGIRSNMRNRMIITVNEDIGISDWKVYLKVNDGINKWEKNRSNDSLEGKRGLIESAYFMAKSKKLRFCSIVRCYFIWGFKSKMIKRKYGIEDPVVGKDNFKRYFIEGKDDVLIKDYISGFVNCLDEKDMNCYFWVFKILNMKGRFGRRLKKYKSCFVLWDIIFDRIKNTKNKNLKCLVNTLFEWYNAYNNSRNENWMYLVNCIYFVMKEDDYDWTDDVEESGISDDRILEYYAFNDDLNKIAIDDFVVDKHCKEGRKIGKNHVDFAKEGSLITNEYENFDKNIYEKVYIDLKIDTQRRIDKYGYEYVMKGGKKRKKKLEVVKLVELEVFKEVMETVEVKN